MATQTTAAESTLQQIAKAMVQPGKGILATDESTGTIAKRFDAIGVENTEENRKQYRGALFSTSDIGEYISGVIMFEETLTQSFDDGTTFVEALGLKGVIPGIKVDKSTHPLSGAPGEVITEGLDGLRQRLATYREQGAKFTKWRGLLNIGVNTPSSCAIDANAHALARYAALSQEVGLVPIVEPEVEMSGDHSIDRCHEATEHTLRRVFEELLNQRVVLQGIVLKPNMVLSGKDAANRASADEVAEKTVTCFLRTVPAAVPGIAFLSGGQGDEEATVNLNAINKYAKANGAPWELTYSYGRGLQAAPQKAWSGRKENIPAAQAAFQERGRANAAARMGKYGE
jgi:fructose-bisphosphate aldolase class I